ncbi:MAG TPA: protein-L-isoaspartate O-methyltransferase [Devosiaceae bacterium]|jgi:protein-L-isoaspartate(D-aspartate) O-methyltransferase
MTDFTRARTVMVDNQLRTSSITDRHLLAVMGQVPRERFVPEQRQALAYIDEAHALTASPSPRYLAAPAPFARLVQLAEIGEGDSVLDIGCGTGYSVAVLAGLAARVTGVESDGALVVAARDNLSALDITNAEIVEAPLLVGPKVGAGYDIVVVEGAVDEVPPALLAHLKEGGRLVALIRRGATASANVFTKAEGAVTARAAFDTSLPSLAVPKPAEAFVF